jgi:hypothetical protein
VYNLQLIERMSVALPPVVTRSYVKAQCVPGRVPAWCGQTSKLFWHSATESLDGVRLNNVTLENI